MRFLHTSQWMTPCSCNMSHRLDYSLLNDEIKLFFRIISQSICQLSSSRHSNWYSLRNHINFAGLACHWFQYSSTVARYILEFLYNLIFDKVDLLVTWLIW